MQARRGELVDVLEGDGLIAELDGEAVGIVAWLGGASGSEAELRVLAVAGGAHGRGVGSLLLAGAEAAMRAAGVRRAWLVTTNDNLAALALYQKAGWRLVAVRAGAIDELRRSLKPSIPAVGEHGIPIRDELELAKRL
jgi:ribosomal protein S18 acetylase RimI-like enzyme